MLSLNYNFEKNGKYYKYTHENKSSYEVIECNCGKWIRKSNIKNHIQCKYHMLLEDNMKLKNQVYTLIDELTSIKDKLKALQDKYGECTNSNTTPFENNPIQLVKDIGQELLIQQESITSWNSSPFHSINKLKPDYSGKIGELFMNRLCQKNQLLCSNYCEDINSKDGTYDIIINNKKIEIKTARLGKHGSFQHENLHLDGYDSLIFMDITPYYYYITILPKFDLESKCKILGRKAHLRKNTNNIYKFDYSEKNIKNAIKEGFTIKIDSSTTFECLNEFVNTKI